MAGNKKAPTDADASRSYQTLKTVRVCLFSGELHRQLKIFYQKCFVQSKF